jgi:adhesin transport system membrane fusion protein
MLPLDDLIDKSALLHDAKRTIQKLNFVLIAGFLALVIWAYCTRLDELVLGTGKVVPSSEVQVIQNLEGGIVEELKVKEGERVRQGQLLMHLDPTSHAADLGEETERLIGLQVRQVRLRADLEGKEPVFTEAWEKSHPDLLREERSLMLSERQEYRSNEAILEERQIQKKQELNDMQGQLSSLNTSRVLALKQMAMVQDIVSRGAGSKLELLKIEQQKVEYDKDIASIKTNITRVRSAIVESERAKEEQRARWRREILDKLQEINIQIAARSKQLTGAADRVDRTEIRSPVAGIINKIYVTTKGGVVKSGMPVFEIVPLDDMLVIEASVQPRDIAFLHPGMHATVEITAYDSGVYGYLTAELVRISADAFSNDKGENFYKVLVRTKEQQPNSHHKNMTIIPGMTARVRLITGEKSVLDYLLKPITRTLSHALHER